MTPLSTTVAAVSRQLCDAEDGLARPMVAGGYTHLPSRDAVAAVVGDLLAVLFPGYFGTLSVLSSEALCVPRRHDTGRGRRASSASRCGGRSASVATRATRRAARSATSERTA